MGDEIKTVRMKNGMSAYIYHDDNGSMCYNPLEWDNAVKVNIWSSRYSNVIQNDFFGDSIPEAWEIVNAVEQVLDWLGKNASGEAYAREIGYDKVITWDLYAEERDDGNSMSTAGYRALSRAVKFLRKKYWWCTISRYEHGNVYYSLGSPTCRWDSGYCGVAVVDLVEEAEGLKQPCKDGAIDVTKKCEEKAEALLDLYSEWFNGEVYCVEVVDAYGDGVDSCGGYIGMAWAEEALQEMVSDWQDKEDTSLLYVGGVQERHNVLKNCYARMGRTKLDTLLAKHGLAVFDDTEKTLQYLYTEAHHRVAGYYSRDLVGPVDDTLFAKFINMYCRQYMAEVLAMLEISSSEN